MGVNNKLHCCHTYLTKTSISKNHQQLITCFFPKILENLILFKSLRVLSLGEGRMDFIQMAELKVFLNNEDHMYKNVHPARTLTQSLIGICVYPCYSTVGSLKILVLLQLNDILPVYTQADCYPFLYIIHQITIEVNKNGSISQKGRNSTACEKKKKKFSQKSYCQIRSRINFTQGLAA